jgi:hypothetical protein
MDFSNVPSAMELEVIERNITLTLQDYPIVVGYMTGSTEQSLVQFVMERDTP